MHFGSLRMFMDGPRDVYLKKKFKDYEGEKATTPP